jgi:hypothetical protein
MQGFGSGKFPAECLDVSIYSVWQITSCQSKQEANVQVNLNYQLEVGFIFSKLAWKCSSSYLREWEERE